MGRLYIFGAGGHAAEALMTLRDRDRFFQEVTDVAFVVDDAHYTGPTAHGERVMRRSDWTPDAPVVVAVGRPADRARIVASLPADTQFGTLVHPTAIVRDHVSLGVGAIVSAFCVVSCASVGPHASLNEHVVLSHDSQIGSYFTAAGGVKVSGNCTIGDRVSIGANASVRERLRIADDVVIGLGAGVVSDLAHAGTYVGVPAIRKTPRGE